MHVVSVDAEGKWITTIEGLEREGKLHPLQAAFVEYDGFQPLFTLKDPEGNSVSSAALPAHGSLVVSFYRGVWCPYRRGAPSNSRPGETRTCSQTTCMKRYDGVIGRTRVHRYIASQRGAE